MDWHKPSLDNLQDKILVFTKGGDILLTAMMVRPSFFPTSGGHLLTFDWHDVI